MTYDIALITSLYRGAPYLEKYSQAVLKLGYDLHQAGIAAQIIIVANDAQPEEITLLDRLVPSAQQAGTITVQLLYVGRESLYSSWNRGIEASNAPLFGPWNIDDARHAGAIIEAKQAYLHGYTLFDFPFKVYTYRRILGIIPHVGYELHPIRFNNEVINRKTVIGTFFIASRSLYDEIGPFDGNYRIAGDLDWSARVMGRSRFYRGTQTSGDFIIHGENLSNTGNIREDIEVNIIFMRLKQWDAIRPTSNSEQMKAAWDSWGNDGTPIPPEIQDKLWGANADKHWQEWLQFTRRRDSWLRRIPRAILKRIGLQRSRMQVR